MKIMILGATGFIGSVILDRLVDNGHEVTGLGRNPERARVKRPAARWLKADLATLSTSDWRKLISDQDAVVNCAGALQDGLSDDILAIQQNAMLALYEAAGMEGGRLIVQISARVDGPAGTLAFLATKRHADTALAASGLPYVILRPALVIGRNAHGGTALLRALASMPGILPLSHAESPVATVSVEDVVEAVCRAIDGSIPPGSDLDLAANEMMTLAELVRLHRAWLGLDPAPIVALPAALAKPLAWSADLAGKLGWRSPLRSTAMTVMAEGVLSTRTGPAGMEFSGAARTLATYPSGIQDLWFARLYLLKPVGLLTLSIFWLLSGLIPLFATDGATAHFLPFMPAAAAITLTIATCLIDILLGLSVLFRPTARKALLGMIAVTLCYLAGGSVLEPRLWLDPLGPLVKVLPSLALTLTVLATLDER